MELILGFHSSAVNFMDFIFNSDNKTHEIVCLFCTLIIVH